MSTSSSDYLNCQDISKSFGSLQVLRGVDLELPRGKCLALLGESGCGKSTLLNIIAGLLRADAGQLTCDGRVLDAPAMSKHVPMRHRRFAMVFQDFSLWPHMRVQENVGFGLRITGVGRRERQQRVAQALDRVSMSPFAQAYPGELSGGQQQRVAIARALVVEPRVLLMDEPLSALDTRLRESLREEVAVLIRELNMTAVYVTHDQLEAFAVGDQVAVMRAGQIEQSGSPQQLYASPQTAFVASFIGASNVYPWQLKNDRFVLAGSEPLAMSTTSAEHQGQCLIRRDAIEVTPEDDRTVPDHSRLHLRGTCEKVWFLGDNYEVVARTETGVSMRGKSGDALQPGGRVRISFDRAQVQFLPQQGVL